MTDGDANTVLSQRGSRKLLVRQFRLASPDGGLHYPSTSTTTTIGSNPGNDLVIDDPAVSRFHCTLKAEPDCYVITDLGSRNGTWVSGVKVRCAEVEPGCTIVLGDTELVFDYAAEQLEVPLSENNRFGGLVGSSTIMRRTYARLERAAELDSTVLLLGESGTGKEVAAVAIHEHSQRRAGPFVVLDCAGLPASLLESELFGHARGAFTGAIDQHEGAFARASTGTIFLDEIGELPLEIQAKFLSVLERRQVRPVGGDAMTEIDVRVIAATNRDLKEEVNRGRFREDLYYRLSVLDIELPPLRERLSDLTEIVAELASRLGGDIANAVDEELISAMSGHRWPGNVREVRNYLERYAAFGEPLRAVAPDRAEASADVTKPYREAKDDWGRAFERSYLQGVLDRFNGNVGDAADAASLNRTYFYRLLSRAGIKLRK